MTYDKMMTHQFRHIDEHGVGVDFFDAMKLNSNLMVAVENDPPDLAYSFDGKKIGIEITRIGNTEEMLSARQKRGRTAISYQSLKTSAPTTKRKSLEDKFNVSTAQISEGENWEKEPFLARLADAINLKEKHVPLLSVRSFYSELWLFINSENLNPTSAYMDTYLKGASFSSSTFTENLAIASLRTRRCRRKTSNLLFKVVAILFFCDLSELL